MAVCALLGKSSLLIWKVGCWRMRQKDEPDREQLAVTSEQQDGPGGRMRVGGTKKLSHNWDFSGFDLAKQTKDEM